MEVRVAEPGIVPAEVGFERGGVFDELEDGVFGEAEELEIGALVILK